MINNLHASSESIARKKEVRKLATHAVLGDASVTTPGKRTQWGEEGAGGYAEAGGRLYWQGPVAFEGPFSNIGPFTNQGKFTNIGELEQIGPTRLRGGTDIEGLTRLLNDLLLAPGGSITVQDGYIQVGTSMRLDPGVSSGALVFSNGAQVFTDGDSIQVYLGNSVVQISNGSAKLQHGGYTIEIDDDGVHVLGGNTNFQYRVTMDGRFFAPNLPPITDTGAVPGTLVLDSSGEVHVAIS